MIQLMMQKINLFCEVNIIANANDINAQTKIIEESSNSQATVESNESDDIIIKLYVGPSSEGSGNGVKMSAEFYKYATDKIKKEKQEKKVAKENMKAKTKQTLILDYIINFGRPTKLRPFLTRTLF